MVGQSEKMVSSYTPQTAVILGIFKRAVQRKKILSVRFADSAVGWTVGGDFGVSIILHTTNGGETWEDQSLTEDEAPIISKQQLSDVFMLDASHVWITGPGGFMISSSK